MPSFTPVIPRDYVELQHTQLQYIRFGHGPKILLAFHGFGQTAAHFHSLAQPLGNDYTVYAFDLFFHGRSYWHSRRQLLTKAFWSELMRTFLAKHEVERFSLVGFSMGGKFALATLESFPQHIDELIFIAPDGIKTSFWYSLATYPGWTSGLFKRMVVVPGAFQQLAATFHRLKIVDRGVVRFAQNQMNSREKRIRVYYSWTIFRQLRFNMNAISRLLNTHGIPTYMFLGMYDRIITEKNMRRLLQKLNDYQLRVLPTGHNHLIDEVASYYSVHRKW